MFFCFFVLHPYTIKTRAPTFAQTKKKKSKKLTNYFNLSQTPVHHKPLTTNSCLTWLHCGSARLVCQFEKKNVN